MCIAPRYFVFTLTVSTLLPAGLASPSWGSVQYQTTTDWGAGFNGQITIKNDTSTTVDHWKLEFDFIPVIGSIWDAAIVSRTGSHYVIQSAGWNDRLAAGGTVSFGFGAAPGNVKTGPQNFNLTGVPFVPAPLPAPAPPPTPGPPPASGTVTAAIAQTGQWTGGFGASLTITNGTSAAVNGWTLSFSFDQTITSLWNAILSQQGKTVTIRNESWTGTIAPGTSVVVGFNGNGAPTAASASQCVFNGTMCSIQVAPATIIPLPGPVAGTPSIAIGGVDIPQQALQFTIAQGTTNYTLALSNQASGSYTVISSNPSAVIAGIVNGNGLQVTGVAEGRTALKIQEARSGSIRYVGIRVKRSDGTLPAMPRYLSVGSVSEDTVDHLAFWQSFQPGPTNKRVDIRYIYLNGGPVNGWDTWGNTPGSRAVTYIRNSRLLGMIPFFVFYNIADGGESYYTDSAHIRDVAYMQAYFKNLKLTLDIIRQESPDDLVGMILEPDFLGYLAQNANQPAAAIPAMTNAAYGSGVLAAGVDPVFPDTVQGLVQAINYTISKYAPQVYFGWQMNLWASPAGGWTTSISGKGLMHKTDGIGVAAGRPLIYQEAAAISRYYLDAGISTYGAKFVSVDKYGLDATGFEALAAQSPADSTWFWNNDLWQNYLTFVRAVRDTTKLPVILWQLPVGHINSTSRTNPYATTGGFPDLTDNNRALEDSAPTFFFGDTFRTGGTRLTYFATNNGQDPKVSVNGSSVTWGSHMADAAANGVISMMFGAGVGASTTNVGSPPTDSYWWISAVQSYLNFPIGLQ